MPQLCYFAFMPLFDLTAFQKNEHYIADKEVIDQFVQYVIKERSKNKVFSFKSKLHIDYEAIQKAGLLLYALDNEVRLCVLSWLHKAGWLKETELLEKLKIDRDKLLNHLYYLQLADLVKVKQEESLSSYTLNYTKVNKVVNVLNMMRKG